MVTQKFRKGEVDFFYGANPYLTEKKELCSVKLFFEIQIMFIP